MRGGDGGVEELIGVLALLRRPELLASLKFVGKQVMTSTTKPVLISEVIGVLRGTDAAQRDAMARALVSICALRNNLPDPNGLGQVVFGAGTIPAPSPSAKTARVVTNAASASTAGGRSGGGTTATAPSPASARASAGNAALARAAAAQAVAEANNAAGTSATVAAPGAMTSQALASLRRQHRLAPPPPASSLPPPAFSNTSIRCPCGRNVDPGISPSSSSSNEMVQCCGPGCGVWQHARCVLPLSVLAKRTSDKNSTQQQKVPASVRRSFLCEACRLADADPCWAPAADLAHASGNNNNWKGGPRGGAAATATAVTTTATTTTNQEEPPARAGLVCPPILLRPGRPLTPSLLAQFQGAKPGDAPAAAEVRFSLSADAKKALSDAAKAASDAATAAAAAPSSQPPPPSPGAVELHVCSVKLGDEVPARVHWPRHAELRVNGLQHPSLYVSASSAEARASVGSSSGRSSSSKLGIGARDAAASVGRLARAGQGNRVLLSSACESVLSPSGAGSSLQQQNPSASSFALVVRLVRRRSLQEMEALVGAMETPEEALARVKGGGGGVGVGRKRKRGGFDSDDDDDGDDVENGDTAEAKKKASSSDSDDDECLIVGTSTVTLRCPLTGARLRDPARLVDDARGPSSAFELGAFLQLGAKTKKWVCPNNPARPAPLRRVRRDGYIAAVLRSLDGPGSKKGDSEVTEIEVDASTGAWRPAGRGGGASEPWRSIVVGGEEEKKEVKPPLACPPVPLPAAAGALDGGKGEGGGKVVVKAEVVAPSVVAGTTATATTAKNDDDGEGIIVLSSSSDEEEEQEDGSAPVVVGGGVSGRAPPASTSRGGRERAAPSAPPPPPPPPQQQQRGLHVRLPPRPQQQQQQQRQQASQEQQRWLNFVQRQRAPPPPLVPAAAAASSVPRSSINVLTAPQQQQQQQQQREQQIFEPRFQQQISQAQRQLQEAQSAMAALRARAAAVPLPAAAGDEGAAAAQPRPPPPPQQNDGSEGQRPSQVPPPFRPPAASSDGAFLSSVVITNGLAALEELHRDSNRIPWE